jgi:DNA polymerase-3 subunit delta
VDYASFLRAVERGQAPAVALLHGPEPFLIEDAVARITRALFPDVAPGEAEAGRAAPAAAPDLALLRETFDARDADVESVVASALMLPWTSARRLVVVKGVEALAAKRSEPLIAFLRAPNPSTVLLLLAGQLLIPSHWLLGALPSAAVVPVVAPVGSHLVAWLRDRARADGIGLDEAAATLLVDLSGSDLTQLRGDVEKAALAGGPANRAVGVAEVRAVVGEHRLRHIFELTRALVAGDLATALSVLERLLNGGEEPLGVLGMLAREVRALWTAAEGLRLGRRDEEIARTLRRPPQAAALMIERARALAPGAAAQLLERCWEAERRLKLSGAARAELSLLVADLCTG